MATTYRFRTKRELAADIVAAVAAITDLAEVRAWFGTESSEFLNLVARVVKRPACVVVIGGHEYDQVDDNMRSTQIGLYLVGSVDKHGGGAQTVHDLAESVAELFLPAAAAPGAPVELAGCRYETVEEEAISNKAGVNIWCIIIRAIDHRQQREE